MRRVRTAWTWGVVAAALAGAPALGQDAPADPAPAGGDADEMIEFSAFTQAMELQTLVDFVADTLGINVAIVGDLEGSMTLNAPVAVPRSQLLSLLDAMLEQHGFTITYDQLTQFYTVRELSSVRPSFGSDISTTRVIHTPNVKPSLLTPAISAMLGGAEASGASIAYVDELGAIVVTASAREIARIEAAVGELLEQRTRIGYHRIELQHIAAPAARERAVGMVGGSTHGGVAGVQAQIQRQQQAAQGGGAATTLGGTTLDNLGDRLLIDAQGNALLFRGTPQEVARVRELIAVIDVPSQLSPKRYFAGSAAQQIADIASQRGLGEVIVLEDNRQNAFGANLNAQFGQQFGQQSRGASVGGPVMVVDIQRGSIVYYGTPAQQGQLSSLLEEIGTDDERIVVRSYRLRHALAEEVAELLNAIISGQGLASDGALLPDSSGVRSEVVRDFTPVLTPSGELSLVGPGGEDVSGAFDPDVVVVVPDQPNNQIVVRAPVGQQGQLEKLVGQLDLRRPQVYVEALIVSVSDTVNFRLAVETQILNGQYGIQSNFGLSSVGDMNGFQDQRNVVPTLGGLTAALIQSESIPFIINAVQTDTDAKIVSRPALLVNNNEEATIASVDEQPTTQQSQGDNTTITSFSGFEEAGTNLTVTPTISADNYVLLNYEVELSNFTGAGSGGVPSPRATNNVSSTVTVPNDATIVVGGIKVSNTRNTVVKVPLLGDIPLLGNLFRDTNEITTDTVLYVFITPRIMTDPNFYDLKLFSEGPQAESDLADGVPALTPVVIGSTTPAAPQPPELMPVTANRQEPQREPQPAPSSREPAATPRDGTFLIENDTPAPPADDGLNLEIVPLGPAGE